MFPFPIYRERFIYNGSIDLVSPTSSRRKRKRIFKIYIFFESRKLIVVDLISIRSRDYGQFRGQGLHQKFRCESRGYDSYVCHLPIPSHGSSEQRFTRDIRIRYSSDVSNFIGYLSLFSERYSFVSIIGSIRERNRC